MIGWCENHHPFHYKTNYKIILNMACDSITAFLDVCGTVRAGSQNVYMLAFKDAQNLENSTKVYALTAGVVSSFGLVSAKKFVKVELEKTQNAITETHTTSETGITTSTATFAGSIRGFNKEGGLFAKSLIGNEVVILVEQADGTFVLIGADGGFRLTETVGTHNNTDSNRTLSFSGTTYDVIPSVDPTLVPTLIA